MMTVSAWLLAAILAVTGLLLAGWLVWHAMRWFMALMVWFVWLGLE